MKETFLNLSKVSDEYRPLLLSELMLHKQASANSLAPASFIKASNDPGMMDQALETGKRYAPAVGYGAAGGALAGIPLALLANALFGKDKSMRGHLRSALMGSILGGGIGALGGGGAKYLYQNNPDAKGMIDTGIDRAVDLGQKYLGGFDASSDGQSRSSQAGNKVKEILGK